MAGREREVKVTVLGDSKGGQRALAELDDRADKTGRHFDGLGGKVAGFAKVAAVGLGGAAVAAGGFMAKAIAGASDLEETLSKVGVVFGETKDQVVADAEFMAKKFGIPKQQFLDASASIGLIGKASGVAKGEVGQFSTGMARLATDAASFYNVPLEEALAAIQSGLTGEAEPMRRFGVLLNENAVKEEAYAKGIAKRGAELTDAQKVQARASLIMKGMSDASGDLERTQGSLANRLREVKGRAENFAASIGSAVLPMVLRLMDVGEEVGAKLSVGFGALKSAFSGEGVTSDGFVGVMERIGVTARKVFDQVKNIVYDFKVAFGLALSGEEFSAETGPQKVAKAIVATFTAVVGWVREHWPEIKHIITETIRTVRDVVVGVVEVLTTIWENFGDQITDVAKAAWKFVRDTIEGALKVIQGIVKVVTGIIKGDWSGVWEGIKQIVSGAWDMIKARIELGINLIKNIISVGLEIVKGIFSGAWDAVFEVTRNVLASVVDVFLGVVDTIITGAAKAFGWVPGIGPKLRQAADWFHEFRNEANNAIRGIDGNIPISADTTRFWDEYWRARAAAERGIALEVSNQPGGGEGVGYAGIQKFHSGLSLGPVRGMPGQDVGIIAKAGEWVATPEQMAALVSGRSGGSSAAVVINLSVGTVVGRDGAHELAEIIRTEQLRYQRRVPGLGYE